MASNERRSGVMPRAAALRRELNPAQLKTLQELETFGWELRFIRHRPFLEPTPVVTDRAGQTCVVIRSDGSLDEHPALSLRH
ncbi:MAG: hypothetical protein KatS3mg126_1966 [Lysobacteraceae bacterium]|nr:MAG: hypothetical protein KatS3mg126_1966 [Xanthomonadaceae bacterium]